MRHPWFWGTLVFWAIFSSAVLSWALIFSPLAFDPRTIRHFQTHLNGIAQDQKIWVNPGKLNRLIPGLEARYRAQGWLPLGHGMDFAPAALGIENPAIGFPDSLQIKFFKKNGIYRTLGLWQSPQEDQTYGWTCDTSQDFQDWRQARSQWSFPFKPPANTSAFYAEKIGKLQIAILVLPASRNPSETFAALCRAQGFEETAYPGGPSAASFLLSKNRKRFVAQVQADPTRTSISVMELN
ncbi:MAG: hypothetical protein ACREL1_04325 [bacterium]